MNATIPTSFHYPSHYVNVLDSKIHYIEEGNGDPILFLHGIPTYSYIWRNIIPHLTDLGCCIAPDLIGMGKSGKPNIEYTIFDHIKYIEKFIEALKLRNITLVMHGWGSVIGLHYAMNHQQNCKGLVFYEAHLRPFNGNDFSLPFQEQIMSLQDQNHVSQLLLNGSIFVDKVLPQGMLRQLSEEEMQYYREPFSQPGSGKPLLKYLEEVSQPNLRKKIDDLIKDYSDKLAKSTLPKLMLFSVPGFVTTIATVMWAKENLSNLEMVDVGEALHYAQESNPVLMGEAISVWLQGLDQQQKI